MAPGNAHDVENIGRRYKTRGARKQTTLSVLETIPIGEQQKTRNNNKKQHAPFAKSGVALRRSERISKKKESNRNTSISRPQAVKAKTRKVKCAVPSRNRTKNCAKIARVERKSSLESATSQPQETNYSLECDPLDIERCTVGLSVVDTQRAASGEEYERGGKWVPEYATDIFHRLYDCETRNMIPPYMHNQSEISDERRKIIVGWVIQVHYAFKMTPETLFLAIDLVDRYASVCDIELALYQLVGVTCLLLAAKFEEVVPIDTTICEECGNGRFTIADVIRMEYTLLSTIDYKVAVPTSIPFLSRFLHIVKAKKTERAAALYYLERVQIEHERLNFRPSLLAAAAVFLALNQPRLRSTKKARKILPGYPQVLETYSCFSRSQVEEAARWMCQSMARINVTHRTRNINIVDWKYGRKLYFRVAKFPRPTLPSFS